MAQKKRRRFSPIQIILILISAGIFIYAVKNLYDIEKNYRDEENTYSNAAQIASVKEPEAIWYPDISVAASSDSSSGENSEAPEVDPYAGLEAPDVDMAALLAKDSNTIGWISLPAIGKGYPLMHASSNDTYLHATLGGTYLYAGSIFLEAKNHADLNDPNSVIFGHNMKNQSMFGMLKSYKDQSVYDSYPAFWIVTVSGEARLYHIFSVHEAAVGGESYVLYRDRSDDFVSWAENEKSKSVIPTSDPIDKNVSVVTLSTCTSDSGERLVVQGVLVYTRHISS